MYWIRSDKHGIINLAEIQRFTLSLGTDGLNLYAWMRDGETQLNLVTSKDHKKVEDAFDDLHKWLSRYGETGVPKVYILRNS